MLPYARLYLALLRKRPGKALKIAWWRMSGKKVRALGRLREAAAELPENYLHWLIFHQPEHMPRSKIDKIRANLENYPPIAIHLHFRCNSDISASAEAIGSVLNQFYDNWTLFLTSSTGVFPELPRSSRIRPLYEPCVDRLAALPRVAAMASESHVIPLDTRHRLTSGALLAYAKAIAADAHNLHRIIYADQDEQAPDGTRRRPWLKPEWDGLLFYAQDYLSDACAIPVPALLAELHNDGLDLYALLLRMLSKEDAPRPHHLPYVATTTREGAWCEATPGRTKLVLSVAQACLGAQAESGAFGTSILRFPLPATPPKVSIIIPTRDRVDLLSTCIDGVLHRTDYPDIEVIIADNGSTAPETLDYFDQCSADPRVKIVHWPYEYNYSAINNFAIRHASGLYLCLLNNDTEILAPDWLREMVSHAVRPEVGAVGARLLYSDLSIQHAGVVVGMGNAAGHAHRGLAMNQPGYFAQALVTRSATAVTAACLVVSKQKFDAVSGLDEHGLAIAYNDVDLCLKLREKGWTNIYAAQAVLLHHESKSRGQDFAPEHVMRYRRELKILQERWNTVGFQDPTHHPALDPASEEYRVRL